MDHEIVATPVIFSPIRKNTAKMLKNLYETQKKQIIAQEPKEKIIGFQERERRR